MEECLKEVRSKRNINVKFEKIFEILNEDNGQFLNFKL
jgi:hypothetical protein